LLSQGIGYKPLNQSGHPPLTERSARPKFRLSRLFWVGVILLVLGSGPLLSVLVLASLGLTKDPNPNPVGFGVIAFLTFWPSVILMIVGVVRSYGRYRSSQPARKGLLDDDKENMQ
jgi:hypothetical protein